MDDLISRNAALQAVGAMSWAGARISNLPPVQPEPKKGKWIKMSDAYGIYYACSECGKDISRVPDFNPQFDLFPRLKSLDKTNFCPNCGAEMEKTE